MLFIFQLVLGLLVLLSLGLIIATPIAFASSEGWGNYKNIIFSGTAAWVFLVFLVGTLNSFVV